MSIPSDFTPIGRILTDVQRSARLGKVCRTTSYERVKREVSGPVREYQPLLFPVEHGLTVPGSEFLACDEAPRARGRARARERTHGKN